MPILSLCSTSKDAIKLIFNWILPALFLREWWKSLLQKMEVTRDKVRGSTEVKEEEVVYVEMRINKL